MATHRHIHVRDAKAVWHHLRTRQQEETPWEPRTRKAVHSFPIPSSGRAYLASLFAPSNSFGDQQNATHLSTSSDFAHIVKLSRSSRPSPAPPEASYMSYPLLTTGVVASTPPPTRLSSPTLAVPPYPPPPPHIHPSILRYLRQSFASCLSQLRHLLSLGFTNTESTSTTHHPSSRDLWLRIASELVVYLHDSIRRTHGNFPLPALFEELSHDEQSSLNLLRSSLNSLIMFFHDDHRNPADWGVCLRCL